MLGHSQPSYLVDKIYNIMEDYETEGIDIYNHDVINAITDYFASAKNDKYQLCCVPWPNMVGGTCSLAVVDNGYPHLIVFDYKY